MTLYERIPEQVKDIARFFYSFVPIEKRMGHQYWELRNFLQTAQWWDEGKIAEWQLIKLKEIIQYAYTYVPGYHDLYHDAGINPGDIQSLQDLSLLPFTTKELLRDNQKAFTTQKISPREMRYITTGGSTGIPFGFYHTRTNRWMENAFMHIGWLRAGWQLGARSIVLRGAYVGSEKKYHSTSYLRNEISLSSYYLSERTYPKYLDFLLKHPANSIQAYPSAITILADLMHEHGDDGKIDVKVILLGSENLYDWQKEKIQASFPNSRLFSFYGHAEQTILAPWCEFSDTYHVWPFYGITELLNDQGQSVEMGKIGEIVGTSFWNFGTPFIRYRTKDFAENGGTGCPLCKRNFQIFNRIEGRLQEFILTSTGRYISMTAINMHSDTFDDVIQFQFFQDQPGKVILKIVPKESYSQASAQKILQTMQSKFSPDVELSLEIVREIPRTRSGKLRFLDQKLEIRYGDPDQKQL